MLNVKSVGKSLLVTGLVVLVAVLGVKIIKQETRSAVEKMADRENATIEAGKYVMMGCMSKGLTDERLGPAIMSSRGGVCVQVLGEVLKNESEGNGYCSRSNKECLYKVGYVRTAMVLGQPFSSKEEVDALEKEAAASFQKVEERGL